MTTKSTDIREVLTAAKNIFCYEPDNENRIILVYDNKMLFRDNPFGVLAHKTIADVENDFPQ